VSEIKRHINPFVVVADYRERRGGWRFDHLCTDSRRQYRRLVVPLVHRYLPTGDYTIEGFEEEVTVERKSLGDLYATLGQGRRRFEREHQRMAAMQFAAVVIEAEWSTILGQPPPRSALNPKTIVRTAMAWSQRYGVHWWCLPGRWAAEQAAFRLLQKFFQQQQESHDANHPRRNPQRIRLAGPEWRGRRSQRLAC
jgi:hypothetical protein